MPGGRRQQPRPAAKKAATPAVRRENANENPNQPPDLDDLDPAERAEAQAELARLAAEGGSATPGAPVNDGTPPPPDEDDDLDSLDDDDEAELEDEGGEDDDYDPDVYVVLSDLVVLKTGPKTNDTLRAPRGQLVRIRADHPHIDIETLLRIKAIAHNDGKAKRRSTAAAMAQASGAPDDPVKIPQSMLVKDVTAGASGDAAFATE